MTDVDNCGRQVSISETAIVNINISDKGKMLSYMYPESFVIYVNISTKYADMCYLS